MNMNPRITPLYYGAVISELTQKPINVSISDVKLLREISDNPDYVSEELFKGDNNGHKFKAGNIATLTGLEDFPEFNGTKVEITSIREDGERGKAYYIKGDIDKFINWVYEYRLK